MNRLDVRMAVFALGAFMVCPVARASITRVPVSKGSKIEKDLGFTITITPNGMYSGLEGTVTVEVYAPRTPKLQQLSRIILRLHQGKELTGRLPLELQKGKSGEGRCHFQLTPAVATGSVLELICPAPGMPNAVVYEIDLSTYLTPESR